jgi:hypothetical protein
MAGEPAALDVSTDDQGHDQIAVGHPHQVSVMPAGIEQNVERRSRLAVILGAEAAVPSTFSR